MTKEPRPVKFRTILDLFKQKHIHLTFGFVLTLLPFAFGLLLIILIPALNSDVPRVDYEQIFNQGKSTLGTITNIETQKNITVNNEHPSVITYRYSMDNNEIESQYKSLAPDKIKNMKIGDTIEVKYLSESSIISGLVPFEFPYDIFLKILIPMLIIGIIALTLLYLRFRTTINLYRYGKVMDAEIVSMNIKNGLPITKIGQGINVFYQYNTKSGQNILGESFTTDFSILNSKKQGDLIKIFVSVDNENKSCLIPKLEQIRNKWEI